jgi:hypothetical protein
LSGPSLLIVFRAQLEGSAPFFLDANRPLGHANIFFIFVPRPSRFITISQQVCKHPLTMQPDRRPLMLFEANYLIALASRPFINNWAWKTDGHGQKVGKKARVDITFHFSDCVQRLLSILCTREAPPLLSICSHGLYDAHVHNLVEWRARERESTRVWSGKRERGGRCELLLKCFTYKKVIRGKLAPGA